MVQRNCWHQRDGPKLWLEAVHRSLLLLTIKVHAAGLGRDQDKAVKGDGDTPENRAAATAA